MLETSKKLVKEINEIKKEYVSLIDEDTILGMDSNTLSLVQRSIKLLDLSCDLYMEQAELMEGIDDKLNKLLKAVEEA